MTPSRAQAPVNVGTAVVVFALLVLVYVASGWDIPDSHDTTPNAYLPVRLLERGELTFSPLELPWAFRWRLVEPGGSVPVVVKSWDHPVPGTSLSFGQAYQDNRVEFAGPLYFLAPSVRERPASGEPLFVSIYGAAAGLVGLPVVAAGLMLGANLQDPYDVYRLARITAALLTAASAAMVFLAALAFTTRRRAIVIACAYGLGSCVWTLSSQALWQQTSALFFLSLGTLCAIRAGGRPALGGAAGFAFAVAAACRPTSAVVALAAAIGLASERRVFTAYVLGAVPVVVLLLAYNHYYFGSPFDFGQFAAGAELARMETGSSDLWQTPLWVGAAGLLLSPSRGLLVYTPFLALAFVGAVLAWREPKYAPLRFLTVAVPGLWLPAFAWFYWWGGWTYGYRPIVDSAPLLAVLCVPAVDRILASPLWKAGFAVALAWSVFVQLLGVLAYTPWQWNARPLDASGAIANIDSPRYRYRLWSLTDSQIVYLIANFGEARAARTAAVAR